MNRAGLQESSPRAQSDCRQEMSRVELMMEAPRDGLGARSHNSVRNANIAE
jgi:hypothetical protein